MPVMASKPPGRRPALAPIPSADAHVQLPCSGTLKKFSWGSLVVHTLHHIGFGGLAESVHHLHVAEVVYHPRFNAVAAASKIAGRASMRFASRPSLKKRAAGRPWTIENHD